MSKFCVFCGNPPENKNAEHIIPQWLIEMTGKKKRPIHLNNMVPNNGQMSFSAFKFPACEKCNSDFSRLEANVKPIIVNILSGNSVSAADLSLLLDWFDKVRIGLWLAELCLTKTVDEIAPHMHIANRMGLKDRMLIIERVADRKNNVSFAGPGNPVFTYYPSAFQLWINDYTFTNVSEYGLVSRRLGFPYCDRMKFYDIQDVRPNTVVKGTNRVQTPVIRGFTPSATQTVIYQPIYKNFNMLSPQMYQSPYVLSHSLDAANGLGGIFYQQSGRPTQYLDTNARLKVSPRISGEDVFEMGAKLYQLHNYVIQNTYTTKFATPQIQHEQALIQDQFVKYNQAMMKMCLEHKDTMKTK